MVAGGATQSRSARPVNSIDTVPPPYPGMGRRVYPGFVQLSAFMLMNINRHVDAHVDLYTHRDLESARAEARFLRALYLFTLVRTYGDIPLPLQVKLLRVLESLAFFRVGGTRRRIVIVTDGCASALLTTTRPIFFARNSCGSVGKPR